MAINDISTLSVLRTKMQWHQERQRVLAQNVANSDTPKFKPLDLVEPNSIEPAGASEFRQLHLSCSRPRRTIWRQFQAMQGRVKTQKVATRPVPQAIRSVWRRK